MPNCHRFKECGSYFIPNELSDSFIEDSPDGLITCVGDCKGKNCRNVLEYPCGKLSIEIKCPFTPIENKTMLPVSYVLPTYNACQVLTHMKSTDTDVLLFASCSKESVAVSFVDFQENVWKQIYDYCNDLYGDSKPTKPTEIQPLSTELKEIIKTYSKNNSILIAEVPLINTVDDHKFENNAMSEENCKVFRKRHQHKHCTPDWENINSQIVDLCDETIALLDKSNNLLRRKATELLLFIATDIDREFNKDLPLSVPIAYGLKGKSIRLDTARNMINVVRDKLKEENISVLVEALDGQWSGIVFRDENKNPLTLYDFDKDCWLKFHLKSKQNIVNLMESYTHVSRKHIEAFSKLDSVTTGHYKTGNIGITVTNEVRIIKDECRIQKILYVYSFCGNLEHAYGMSTLRTPSRNKRPDLWGLDLGISGNLLTLWGFKHSIASEKDSNIETLPDLDEEGRNLQHDLINADIYEEESSTSMNISVNIAARHNEPECKFIRRLLLTEKKVFLEQILITLMCLPNGSKWESFHINNFYDRCLNSAHVIQENFTSIELNTILKFIKQEASHILHIPNFIGKIDRVNAVAYLLGHTDTVYPKGKKLAVMLPLRVMCHIKIKNEVPLNVIKVGCAEWLFDLLLPKWLERSPVPVVYKVPSNYHSDYSIFSYPEYNRHRSQIEPRVIDPSHILTNLRLHATTKGFFGLNSTAFQDVAKERSDILNLALVQEPIADKQNVPFAQKVFSESVELELCKLGYLNEAFLVRTVRNWYNACNERGLTVETRLEYMLDMDTYLSEHYACKNYPMNLTHVDGLPSTTYQALRHNICTRIQLYSLSNTRTYNQRAVSTLAVESFFSDLTALSSNTSGVPLSAHIPGYLAKVTKFNTIKHDPTKLVPN